MASEAATSNTLFGVPQKIYKEPFFDVKTLHQSYSATSIYGDQMSSDPASAAAQAFEAIEAIEAVEALNHRQVSQVGLAPAAKLDCKCANISY